MQIIARQENKRSIISAVWQRAFGRGNRWLITLSLFVIMLFFLGVPAALGSDTIDDLLIYRGGGSISIPEYRLKDEGGFEAELTAQDVSSAIEYVRSIAKPISLATEKILCTKDSADDVNCQVYDGSAWGNLLEVSPAAGGLNGYDLAYEQVSGEAMVCYRTPAVNTQTPGCRLWDGSSWGAEFYANSVGGAINTMRLIPDPNSDYIAMITRDGPDDLNVQIWDGSSWGNLQEVSLNVGACTNCLMYDGAWEKSAADFVVAWFDDAGDALYSREFDKSSLWGAQITDVITGLSTSDNVYVEMDSNPNPTSDTVLAAVIDDDNTLNVNAWDGSAWSAASELSVDVNGAVANNTHLFDLAFENIADYDAVLTYGSTAAALKYRVWDSGTAAWGTEQSLPTAVEAKDWHQLAADPYRQNIMLTTVGITNDVDTIEWTGSSWDSNWISHEVASNDVNWNAWYVYDYENEDNHPPVVSFNSATQKINGTGLVDISVDITDEGLDDVKLKIEYETDADGACNGPWASATLQGPATADFNDSGGAPDINNAAAYQVGSGANTRIVTDSGANTVQFDWASATDLPAGNATYCLRATGSDDADDSVTPDTLTLTIDNVAPTGLDSLVSFGASDMVQHLNWAAVTETNFDHYEVWYGTSQSDVQNRSGTATEFDQDDFLALNSSATFHTHIMGLTPSTLYYYKIWAVDDYGNEETVADLNFTTDPPGNNTPTASDPNTISQAVDGTGYVTFTTTIYDSDIEGVEMRVRFSADGGTTFYNAKIVSATPDYDNASIDDNDFQIGHIDHIDLEADAPHPVTVVIVWDTKSVDNQNGGLDGQAVNVIIRVTPRDEQGEIGSDYDSDPFALDNSASVVSEVTPVPTGTTDTTPNYTFNATAAGDITYGGSCSSATVLAATGSNTITFNALAAGTYSDCTITVTDAFNNDSNILAVSTFTVDQTAPSGLSALVVGANTQTTQTLSWTAVTETNFNHYEIWYGTNQAEVQNRNGAALEWDNSDDSALATRTTVGTTITGLAQNTLYYYKIWAVDIATQEETVSDVNATTDLNIAPGGTISSIIETTDGSMEVAVTISVTDDDGDSVQAKLEYETDFGGACNGPWANATVSGPVVATTDDSGGAPDVNNAAVYQLGSGSGTKILTSSGANAVQFQWDVATDLPTANSDTVCLRLTTYDGLNTQAVPATATALIDLVAPVVSAAYITHTITVDNNVADVAGLGDEITITWDNSAAGDNNSDVVSVSVNLEGYGGPESQAMYDDGTNGDTVASDDIYTFAYTVVAAATDSINAHPHIIAVDSFGNEIIVSDDMNLVVDAEAPTAPGNLSLASNNVGSATLSFGAASSAADFSTYKIFYRTGSAGVSPSDTEQTDVNLGVVNFNGASGTTISGLLLGRTYYFNIWVYDDAGNSTSASEINITTALSGMALPINYANSPTPPAGGFKISCPERIGADIQSNIIALKFSASSDVNRLAIGIDPELRRGTGIISYAPEYNFDLCGYGLPCVDGNYTIYARFYTQFGVASDIVSCRASLTINKPIAIGDLQAPVMPIESVQPVESVESGGLKEDESALTSAESQRGDQTITSSIESQKGIAFHFTRPLFFGLSHPDVLQLQKLLNEDSRTRLAVSGPGSSGRETNYFGVLTRDAVHRFQLLYQIARPGEGGFGLVGPLTRAQLNQR